MQGGFSVQLGNENPFGRIPVDQTIEETINKDTQTPGGTKGFSLNPGAVRRFYLSAEFRSSYLRQLRHMTGLGSTCVKHADVQPTRVLRDEADVQSLIDLLVSSWINPFREEQDGLVNIATGADVPEDILKDLMSAKTTGEEAYQNFQHERIENDRPDAVDFFAKMKKQNLKTFANIGTKKLSCKGKEVIMKGDRNLFGRMIVIAQTRQLDMREVLAHPLGPVPWSLANGDGSLRKTDKAKLLNYIGQKVPPAENVPDGSTYIIDGMSVIQKLNGRNQTFGAIAKSVLKTVLQEASKSKRIDVVFDVYLESSIKNAERIKRGSGTGVRFRSIVAGQRVQQWRNFLSEAENKMNLIQFITEEWKRGSREVLGNKVLYVTCREQCWKMTSDDYNEVPELTSSQEEADTRLILHAKHAAENGCTSIVIVSEDTDVFVLCLCFAKAINCSHLYQKRSIRTRTQLVDIVKARDYLGEKVCDALIGLHAFTGCDTVSAFAGRGKVGPLRRLQSNTTFQEAFSRLGMTWEVTDELFSVLQHFVCLIYAPSTKTTSVNQLRHALFFAKRGEVESSLLPPCEDSLMKHVMRANYQALVWRRSMESNPSVPNPVGHGWSRGDDGVLTIDWLKGKPAPDAVMELIACQCQRTCKAGSCACIDNGLKCTTICRLQHCSNQQVDDDAEAVLEVDINSDSGDDDDDDGE